MSQAKHINVACESGKLLKKKTNPQNAGVYWLSFEAFSKDLEKRETHARTRTFVITD